MFEGTDEVFNSDHRNFDSVNQPKLYIFIYWIALLLLNCYGYKIWKGIPKSLSTLVRFQMYAFS